MADSMEKAHGFEPDPTCPDGHGLMQEWSRGGGVRWYECATCGWQYGIAGVLGYVNHLRDIERNR